MVLPLDWLIKIHFSEHEDPFNSSTIWPSLFGPSSTYLFKFHHPEQSQDLTYSTSMGSFNYHCLAVAPAIFKMLFSAPLGPTQGSLCHPGTCQSTGSFTKSLLLPWESSLFWYIFVFLCPMSKVLGSIFSMYSTFVVVYL